MTPRTELIEKIVAEVLKQVARDAREPGPDVLDSSYLILAKKERTDLLALEHAMPKGVNLVFPENFSNLQVLQVGREYENIIIPYLSMRDMADLALGRPAGQVQGLVLQLLMSGHSVQVVEYEYQKKYKDTAPPPLLALFTSYEKRLESYGLTRFRRAGNGGETIQKRLLTEKDMKEFLDRGITTLTVLKQTLITSLADDLAKAKGMTIIKK